MAEKKVNGIAIERDQLLVALMFAARNLAEKSIEIVNGVLQCRECLATREAYGANGRVAHAIGCGVGHVLRILDRLELRGDDRVSGVAAACAKCGAVDDQWTPREWPATRSWGGALALNERVVENAAGDALEVLTHECRGTGGRA